jgi:DNA-binding LacI/PurR family transcriptional regulator
MERERGFFEALRKAEINETAKSYGDFTILSGMKAMADLSAFRPDAVFCANDYMAMGAIRFLTESGRRIPQDTAVVGYDNNDVSIGLVPPLTTVDNRLKEAGESIGQELMNLIKGEKERVRKSILPVLIERESHRYSGDSKRGKPRKGARGKR